MRLKRQSHAPAAGPRAGGVVIVCALALVFAEAPAGTAAGADALKIQRKALSKPYVFHSTRTE